MPPPTVPPPTSPTLNGAAAAIRSAGARAARAGAARSAGAPIKQKPRLARARITARIILSPHFSAFSWHLLVKAIGSTVSASEVVKNLAMD